MWIELFSEYTPHLRLSVPATREDIARLERELGLTLPDDLQSVLSETNGACFGLVIPGEDDVSYFSLVWSTDEILEENVRMRRFIDDNPGFGEMCGNLLFFASTPNGDNVAFRHRGGIVSGPEIISVSHKDYLDVRQIEASMLGYFRVLLEVAAEMK